MTNIQHNADEIVAAGVNKNLAMKVASIIERSIATPINGIKAEMEKLNNSLK